jgi:hypothetical protein
MLGSVKFRLFQVFSLCFEQIVHTSVMKSYKHENLLSDSINTDDHFITLQLYCTFPILWRIFHIHSVSLGDYFNFLMISFHFTF